MSKENIKKYDFIASLGAICACSYALRSKNLQDYSYPFDWIGRCSLKGRIELLLNKFDDWMHIEDMEIIGKLYHPFNCDIYRSTKTGLTYNHDFPLNVPLEESFPEVKARYDRRTSRMVKMVEQSKKILFVYVEAMEEGTQMTYEQVKECYDLLKTHYPDKEFNIKYFFYTEGERYYQKYDNIEIIGFDYKVRTPGAETWDSDIKGIAKYLEDVRLKRKFSFKKLFNTFFEYRVVKRGESKRVNVKIFGIKFQFKKIAPITDQNGENNA